MKTIHPSENNHKISTVQTVPSPYPAKELAVGSTLLMSVPYVGYACRAQQPHSQPNFEPRVFTVHTSLSTLDLDQFLQACGVLGFFLYVGAFAALQLQLIEGKSPLYTVANIAAASLVMLSLIVDFNLASVLIQGCWIMIGVVGLMMRRAPKPALAP